MDKIGFDLQDRLIDFAVRINSFPKRFLSQKPANILKDNYYEAELHLLPIMERRKGLNPILILFIN